MHIVRLLSLLSFLLCVCAHRLPAISGESFLARPHHRVSSHPMNAHAYPAHPSEPIALQESRLSSVPNILSLSRLFAVPFFIAAYVTEMKSLCTGLFVASCLTDYLDGFIARRLNVSSDFGAFIDPVADKITVVTAMIMLLVKLPQFAIAIPVAMNVAREVFVSGLREWMATKGRRSVVKVGFAGKLKTATQMVSTAMLLHISMTYRDPLAKVVSLSGLVDGPKELMVAVCMFYLSLTLSWISAFQYLSAAWPALTNRKN
mmetsp:Transcript_5678/g.8609  ORF Transcript_5678/g.8609 Transcript_5678/m.8609 type:complete len:260 (-) Transcript_5678:45-824(-)